MRTTVPVARDRTPVHDLLLNAPMIALTVGLGLGLAALTSDDRTDGSAPAPHAAPPVVAAPTPDPLPVRAVDPYADRTAAIVEGMERTASDLGPTMDAAGTFARGTLSLLDALGRGEDPETLMRRAAAGTIARLQDVPPSPVPARDLASDVDAAARRVDALGDAMTFAPTGPTDAPHRP